MKEKVDYLLRNIPQQDLGHGGSNKKLYYLTPKSFKKCLMRAQRRPGQSIDPTKYCDYFLLLDKLYSIYQKSYCQSEVWLFCQKIN